MRSKLIRLEDRAMDKNFEPPFGIQFFVNKETCNSERVVMGYTVMPPNSRNRGHAHNAAEVVWHMMAGNNHHIWRAKDGSAWGEGPGSPGTFGYVSPGDYHTGINTRRDLRGEVIFCYAGVNDQDDADTVWIDPPQIVVDHLAERGLTLDDVQL